MPKNEDGEFELILGNRQLLSVFFIVVVLLGVFFTMGYIVGRNSGPSVIAEAESGHKDAKPLVVDPATPTPTPVVETPAPTPEPTPEPKPAERLEPVAKPDSIKPSAAPAAGQTYLQLAATTKHEADIEVDVLRKKGFRALDIENPDRPGLFRVLVGPIPEGGLNKTKSDLDAAGFPGDRAIRRTF